MPRIACRAIVDGDRLAVVDLLCAGFPERRRWFWERAMERLAANDTPAGFPRFGYLLDDGTRAVGVLLMIAVAMADGSGVRCNVSSWYVLPRFRVYASQLVSRALADRAATYLNLSAGKETWPLLEAQGYRRTCRGHILCAPWLSARGERTVVELATAEAMARAQLPAADARLLADHAALGCVSVIATSGERAVPFVFQPQYRRWRPPHALLVWCRSVEDFVAAAAPIGWFLVRRGLPLVLLGADEPRADLVGRFVEAPKFCKGPQTLRPGDLAYSEYPVFGI